MRRESSGNDALFCFTVPCLFGLEGLCADELKRLGYSDVRAENGRVLFSGGTQELAGANLNLRTGERVLLNIGKTSALSFDELFEGVRAMPWENYIPADGTFPVKGHSLNSKLHSIPDCQSIIKKAVVTRLQKAHKTEVLPESAETYRIQFAITDDTATLYLDTSGAGLHKRGYRPVSNAAPLRETLAAAIVKLSRYRGRECVLDPFCGSGTIPIEAALTALNRAPGLNRDFVSEKWKWIDKAVWKEARAEAKGREYSGQYDIRGIDIDPESIEVSKANAKRAGVANQIRFETADAMEYTRDFLAEANGKDLTILSNPPYGERVMEPGQAEQLYMSFGDVIKSAKPQNNLKMYILSSHTEFERTFGKRAAKKRKLYNGMIKCDLYMYF